MGFACGMERLALLLPPLAAATPDFFIVAPDEAGRVQGFALACALRRLGLSGELDYAGGSFKSLMRRAAKSGARYCCIIGPDEAAAGLVTLRGMASGEQESLPQTAAPARLAALCADAPTTQNHNG